VRILVFGVVGVAQLLRLRGRGVFLRRDCLPELVVDVPRGPELLLAVLEVLVVV